MKTFWKLLMMMYLPCFSFAEEGGGGDAGGSDGEGGDDGSGGGDPAGGEGGSGDDGAFGDGKGVEQGGGSEDSKPDLSTAEGYLEHARANGAFDSADKYTIQTEFEGMDMRAIQTLLDKHLDEVRKTVILYSEGCE